MKNSLLFTASVAALLGLSSTPAHAIFVDGQGHYSLRGETRTNPNFDKSNGTFQAIEQYFRLNGELRVSDKASFMLEFRLFDNPRAAYLGDTAQPAECSPIDRPAGGEPSVNNTGNAANCVGRAQNTSEPGYAPYMPRVTEAYAQYAMDFCLLKAGRRSRNWGMGIFLNNDYGPFDTASSIFDGVSCDINIQKSQTLAFSFGYDKLQETGTNLDETDPAPNRKFGPAARSDDLDQYFFTIQYDDRKANAGSPFTQQVGIYFANIVGGEMMKTDIKFADLFMSFFLQDLTIKQEVLFRLGKSADPSYTRLGGSQFVIEDAQRVKSTNKLDSIAAAGSLEYTLSRSGSAVGPEEFKKGNATSHSIFLEYAYAPGDKDGYTALTDAAGDPVRKDNRVTAVAFHRNFKPGLILFNGKPSSDTMRIDGVFDPGRLMNALVLGTGYRYKSLESGNFEIKLLGATMDEGMPGNIKALYANSATFPAGYKGDSIGYELDLQYDTFVSRGLQVGLNGGVALPGEAWQTSSDKPAMSFLLQSFVTFTF